MKQLSPITAPPPRAVTLRWLRPGRLLAVLALLWSQLASAQTTLINETFEGGALGSFVAVNGTATNRWVAGPNAGNGASVAGTGAAYISNNPSTLPHLYSTGSAASVVHLYRDVTFPAGETVIRFSFDWRGMGENLYDNLRVYLAPTTYAPTAGTLPAGAGVTLLQGPLYGQADYATIDLNLPNSLAGGTQRLIFTWTNDNSGGVQPPAALDNVLLTSQVPTGLSGTFTINPAAASSASNFRSLSAAINTLNANGAAGAVTFQLAAGLTLTENPPAITTSGTAANRVTFTRTGSGPNPVLQTAAPAEAGIDLLGADYVTIDGIDVTGGAQCGYRVRSASGTNGAANNIIRNASITLSGANNTVGLVQASNGQYGSTSASAASGLNQGNRYQNLTVMRAQQGIVALSMGASWPEYDLEISGCTLGAADGTAPIGNNATNAYGIRTFMIKRLSVHDNRVQHVVGTPAHGIYLEYCQGIGTNLTSAPAAGAGNDACNIYNNVVQGIRQFNNHSAASYGLYVTTYNANGQVLNVYNNAITDLTAAPYAGVATSTRLLTGLYLSTSGGYNNVANVWFNSVRLDGSASPNASNACFELAGSSAAKLTFRNNVLANYTGAGAGKHYCLLTPYTNPNSIFGTTDGVSDFNDLFVANAGNGFVAAMGNPQLTSSTADKATLLDWRNAAFQDPGSFDFDPLFESATLLKPTAVRLNNQARTVSGISTDLTGAARGTSPDPGAYEFSPASLDLAAEALLAPGPASCYSPTGELLMVRLRNNGSAPFVVSPSQPVTITVEVSGPVTQTLTGTYTASTTLAAGSVWQVQVPGSVAMAQPGTYTFAVRVSTPNDQVPSNDVLTPAATRTVRAAVAQPQAVDFAGYTGSNLSTTFPNWYEAQGASLPVPAEAIWTSSTTAAPGNTVARLNLYGTSHQEWLVGPKIVATSSTVFRFKAAISEYNSALTTPDNTGGMAGGTDDALQVMVSTDCGSSFAPAFTISAASGNVPPNGGGFTDFVVPLGSYDGQQIIVALKATDGPVNNSPDYDVVVDDLYLGILTADVGVIGLINPSASGCYSGAEDVRVRVQNFGAAPVSNVPVQVTVGGPVSTTLTATLPGPIPANGTAEVTVGQVSLTATGTYTFDATTQLSGDVTTTNDALPQQTRRQNGLAALPQQLPFTGFADNLSTLYPGWFESTSGSSAGNSNWTSGSAAQRAAFTETAKVNLYGAGRFDFIIGPRILATATTRLSFRAGITEYNQAGADPTGMAGTDDQVAVAVSTSCGGSFSHVYTFKASNLPPNNGTLALYDVDLSTFAGQEIIVAFIATTGTSDPSDYDFHLDDVYLRNATSLDVRPVALAAPQLGGCFGTAEPVLVTVKNDGAAPLDLSLNPVTVTAVVTLPGGSTRTLTSTLSTGTLATGATLDVPAGTLDMSAVGSYSFALTASATGDGNTSNDQLGTAIVRTVSAPSAGAITPSSAGVCENASVQLTLSGSLYGQVQWQQSADNVTFTDIAGATGLSYTSPALTTNTWFRAQTRCVARVATTAAVAVTVGTPRVISATSPVRRCGPGNVSLSATLSGGAAARWYDAPTGGTVVSTSTSFTLNATSSRSYYVAAVVTNGSGGECESARTEVQVLIDQAATVDAGPATATVCGGGSYALSGSIGGGATSATWTSTGTGTFSPNANTLNASYQPSAADRAAGTVTLKLTTNAPGACGAAQDQLVLTIGGTLSTWTGAFNNDWFDARNWTDCVPDATTDALIPTPSTGRPNPAISTGTAAVRHLTVDGTGGLTMSGGLLRVWGGWQHSATNTTSLGGGTVQFEGDVDQTLSGDVRFANLTINKTNGAALLHGGHAFVKGTLSFLSGRIQAVAGPPVTLEAGARLSGESETSYVEGRLETTLNLNAPDVTTDCNGLGLRLTPHGVVLPGATTVLRTTSFYYSRPDGPMRLSIRRSFAIQAAADQGLNVDLELRYLDAELNGLDESKLTLFSSANNSASWNLERHESADAATNTVRQTGLTHFSLWTLAEGPATLPISLISLSADVQADNQVLVRWETAQERDVLRYEVQASTDGRQFHTVGTVRPASANSTSRRQYRFLDREAMAPGIRYYRLREVDQDGTVALFGPRAVQIGRAEAVQLSAAPNPFSSELRLRLSSPTAQPATPLRLLDASGRVVLTRSIDVAAGTTELTLPGLDHLPAGLYTLHLALNGQPQRLKVLKQ